jgi:nicotinate-nucleotide adenylyltransferase
MGADNLDEIPRWHRWEEIFESVPVAVFNRPSYAVRALSGAAARRFAAHRLPGAQVATLADRRPPAWLFLWRAHHPASATALRGEPEETRLRGTTP